MNKNELITGICKKTGISKGLVKAITNQFISTFCKNLQNSSKISLRDFGTFQIVDIGSRRAFNISTRSIENRPPTRKLRFSPSLSFKEAVKQTEINSNIVHPNKHPHQVIKEVGKIKEGKLNLGNRSKNHTIDTPTKIEYDGVVTIDKFLGVSEHGTYPAFKTPKFGAAILKPQKIDRYSIVGITEPVLLKALRALCTTNTEITIIENVAVPIENWDKPYIPDFVLHHKRANLYIDIEIDEPYDITSRKPIHFIGCKDFIRDNYLIDKGWIIIRYSELQISKHLTDVILDLQSKINWLLSEGVSQTKLTIENRWTFQKAEELSLKKYRENYLGINTIIQENHLHSTNELDDIELYNISSNKKELTPKAILSIDTATEIINQIEYAISSKPKYIRVTFKDTRQIIIDGNSLKVEDVSNIEKCIICKCSYRNWDLRKIKSSEISKIEPISLFGNIYCKVRNDKQNRDQIRSILIDASLSGTPIWIKYRYKRWVDTESIEYEDYVSYLYLSVSPPNREGTPKNRPSLSKPFIDIGSCMNKRYSTYIGGVGISPYFNVDYSNVIEIRILNCSRDYYNTEVYENSMRELLLRPYNYPLRFLEQVEALISLKSNYNISELLYKKLLAHLEVIKGNIYIAMSYYLSFNYNIEVDFDDKNQLWGHSCINDINSYINQSCDIKKHWHERYNKYGLVPDNILKNFSLVKGSLIEHGWNWE